MVADHAVYLGRIPYF